MVGESVTNQNRFEIVKVLGRGAYGVVYHVRDHEKEGRGFALKVLENSAIQDKFTRDRFLREIFILTTIRHENLVNAYELVNFQGKDGYTMELVSGKDLGSIVDSLGGQSLSNEKITSIMTQLLSGLAELHKMKIVHRDIKLDNILLGLDGVVKLNDLGLAKVISDTPMTDPGLILGTAHYMSPEYILQKSIDHRSDLYAVGVILWELIHGRRRFDSNSEKVLIELVESNFDHPLPQITAENYLHCKILKKALAVDVDARFQSAEQMKQAFSVGIEETNNIGLFARYKATIIIFLVLLILLLALSN